ncbi:helix-turn-helix transcriptional regulator [Pseudonocardia sp. RS11V-5]|uniref:helix-turn-helix transcriptional regulator n=1 Tax=Pseudonocardia terrae TaxID=2905831 RepID=UPI001E345B89|nr:helix-turn-helix transcriptional regulator [Pseudonocardia terrae]MCE3551445.1 helix-turn-helix transcriptional regulator [Pseudonocardia terrae]
MQAVAATSLDARHLTRVFEVLERVDRSRDVAEFAGRTLEALGSVLGYRNTTFFAGPTYGGLFLDPSPLLEGTQRRLIREYRQRWDRHDVFAKPAAAARLHRVAAVSVDADDPVPPADRPYRDWLAGHGIESLTAVHVAPGGRQALFGIFGPRGTVGPVDLAVLRLLGRQLGAIARHLPASAAGAAGVPRLSPRLAEAAGLVASGLTNAVIARTMGVAEDTVKKYVSRLLAETGTRSRTELALVLQQGR